MATVSRPWSEEEDQQLLAMAAEGDSSVTIGAALGRTHRAVTTRLYVLREGGDFPGEYRAKDARCTWTPDQDSLLLLHYGSMSNADLAKQVGKTERSLRMRISRLRRGQANTQVIQFPAVATTTRRPHNIHSLLDRALYPETAAWGVFDDFRVRLFYGDVPLPELAARLGRTVNAVRARVNKLGWSLDKAIAFRLEVSRSPLWIEALQAMQAMEDTRRDK